MRVEGGVDSVASTGVVELKIEQRAGRQAITGAALRNTGRCVGSQKGPGVKAVGLLVYIVHALVFLMTW
jgi:hypothetical protein